MLTIGLLSLLLSIGQPEPGTAVVGDDFHANEPEFVQLRYEPAFLTLFDEHRLNYSGGGYRDRLFRYRLFVPQTSGPENRRPLIVWLHGRGTAGDDNASHLRHVSSLILTKPWERERFPFFVLAIQCPRENPIWTTNSAEADDMINVVWAAIEKTIHEFPVDVDRIVLTGASSGGSGCWELAMRRPDVFAAVAPLASGGADSSRINRLVDVPVWVFHSAFDSGTPIEAVRRTVAALEAVDGSVHLTEVDSHLHDCWTAAFEEHDLLEWLLSQKRGSPGRPPGVLTVRRRLERAWHSYSVVQMLGQIGIPLLVFFAIWSARRQRRKRNG